MILLVHGATMKIVTQCNEMKIHSQHTVTVMATTIKISNVPMSITVRDLAKLQCRKFYGPILNFRNFQNKNIHTILLPVSLMHVAFMNLSFLSLPLITPEKREPPPQKSKIIIPMMQRLTTCYSIYR